MRKIIGLVFRVGSLITIYLALNLNIVDMSVSGVNYHVGPSKGDEKLARHLKLETYTQVKSEKDLGLVEGPLLSDFYFSEINPFRIFNGNQKVIRVNSCQSEGRILEVIYPAFRFVGDTATLLVRVDPCDNSNSVLEIQSSEGRQTFTVSTQSTIEFTSNEIQEGDNCYRLSFFSSVEEICIKGLKKKEVIVVGHQREVLPILKIWPELKHVENLADLYRNNGSAFSKLILINQPIDKIERHVNQLKKFVLNGGELVVVGGNNSFSHGKYENSDFEAILPVFSNKIEQKADRMSMAVYLLVDKSGSMRVDNKIERVRYALKTVIRSMRTGDYLGIIGFDVGHFVVFPLTRLTDDREHLLHRTDALRGWGGTDPVSAMIIAKSELENLKGVGVKHMIILTDGEFKGDPNPILTAGQLIANSKITISGILVGREDSKILRNIVSYANGNYYHLPDPSAAPEVFLKDIYRQPTKNENQKKSYKIRWASPDYVAKLSFLPPLSFVNNVKAKPGTEAIVETQEGAMPVVTKWNLGKGHVISIATDLSGNLNPELTSWLDYPEFLKVIFEIQSSPLYEIIVKKIGRFFLVSRHSSFDFVSEDQFRYDASMLDMDKIVLENDMEKIILTLKRPGRTNFFINDLEVMSLIANDAHFHSNEGLHQNITLVDELVKLRKLSLLPDNHKHAKKNEKPNILLMFVAIILWLLGALSEQGVRRY
ncbi:MAG: VWA domain-containing protein [Deltaproteobacteria bacterium]|nr:VWA domain-containing protein [Deltaproteobacteria bacterium]